MVTSMTLKCLLVTRMRLVSETMAGIRSVKMASNFIGQLSVNSGNQPDQYKEIYSKLLNAVLMGSCNMCTRVACQHRPGVMSEAKAGLASGNVCARLASEL